MRKIDLEEQKKIELEILDVVDKFCREHDIKYGLCYGSLIGAVRHKGFIPWDDDIDIAMLRPDYDKFMELFNKFNTRYQCKSAELDKNFTRPFMRVSDTNTLLYDTKRKFFISIDIFCWDNAPDDDKALEEMFRRKLFWHRLYSRRCFPISSLKIR